MRDSIGPFSPLERVPSDHGCERLPVELHAEAIKAETHIRIDGLGQSTEIPIKMRMPLRERYEFLKHHELGMFIAFRIRPTGLRCR